MTTVEMPPLERKLVAILAADVEGYSRLMHEDEARTLETLTGHRAIIDSLITSGRGEISGTAGDSVLAEFPSVVDAVNAAVAIQQELTKANNSHDAKSRMSFRIGVNVGDVMVKGGTIFGDGVNVAARLEAIAEPGGICVTRGVRDHLRDKMDYHFEDLGEHKVKNIPRPVRVFKVLFDPLGIQSFPSPKAAGVNSLGVEASSAGESEAVELAFWQSVQDSDDPTEFQAYLQRFPEGAFVSLARKRLSKSKSASSEGDKTVELEFWNSIKESDVADMFQAYLDKYPEGEFRMLAEIRLRELSDPLLVNSGPVE